jgi:hypothetical protein
MMNRQFGHGSRRTLSGFAAVLCEPCSCSEYSRKRGNVQGAVTAPAPHREAAAGQRIVKFWSLASVTAGSVRLVTRMRARVLLTAGTLYVNDPSFGVFAAATRVQVAPPFVDRSILTSPAKPLDAHWTARFLLVRHVSPDYSNLVFWHCCAELHIHLYCPLQPSWGV